MHAEPTRRDMSRPLMICTAMTTVLIGAILVLAQPFASAGWAQEPPHIGGNAVVSGTDGDGLVVRDTPGLGQGARTTLAEGARCMDKFADSLAS